MSQPAIISGTLKDLDLSMVMDVTSLGRQTLRLEVTSPNGEMIGFVVLKAGRVISAQAGKYRGQAALGLILAAEARAQFRVVRDTTDVKSAAPLGLVGEPVAVSKTSTSPFAEGTQPKIRVMEGSLSEFDIPTLLQTIGIGRSYMEVDVLSESGETIGSVFLKAGKVVSAQAGSYEGLRAVRELMDTPKNFQFAVFRVDEDVSRTLQNVDPVGGLGQVLMEAQPRTPRSTRRAESTDAGRAPIMAGLLSEFDVPTLLQTLGAGRQYIGLEVHNDQGVIGTIMVKAGMVMSASAGDVTGVPAFCKVVQSPQSYSFRVFRTNEALPTGQPLGPMHKLLMSALEAMPPVAASDEQSAAPTAAAPPAAPATQPVMWLAPPVVPQGRAAIMAGNLADFGIVTLLETLSENRQHTLVELLSKGEVLGMIHVKAGKVCAATAGAKTGAQAFYALLAAPTESEFCVYRQVGAVDVPAPLGSIRELIVGVPETPAAAADPVHSVDAAPATATKRHAGVWVGLFAAAAAGLLFLLWPRTSVQPVESPVVSMDVEPTPTATDPAAIEMDTEPAVPVQETKPAEPAVPVQETKPAEPAVPVQETKPAKPAVPVQETKPAKVAPQPAAPRMSVRAAQATLARLGYPVGPIDNVYGPKTRAALTAFQTAEQLDVTGTLNAETMQALAAKK